MTDLYYIEVFRHGAWREYGRAVYRMDALLQADRLGAMGYKVRVTCRGEVVDD